MSRRPEIALGPLPFNWDADRRRAFYARVADTPAIDTVYLGEVVCLKRQPLVAEAMGEAVETLVNAGKRVIHSAPALVLTDAEREHLAALAESGEPVEANDPGALYHLAGRAHHVGPWVNVYNESTLRFLADRGAASICLPPELPGDSVRTLARTAGEAGVTAEAQGFGRLPLAISARCYHARAHGLTRDSCRYVCGEDPDGLPVGTLDGDRFLAVNGPEVLSDACGLVVHELPDLVAAGVGRVRLSPHATDMAAVAHHYAALLEGSATAAGTDAALRPHLPAAPANGFLHGTAGLAWIGPEGAGPEP